MSKSTKQHPTIADELVMGKIYTIRGLKVMLDRDLADLYGLDTKRLKEAVRRNKERFPLGLHVRDERRGVRELEDANCDLQSG